MIAWILVALFFALACFAGALWFVEREKLASYKRIGQWYEHRVEELENETRQLAMQVVQSTGHPGIAMPLQEPEPYYEYASDPSGIVVERLDPRDLPLGQ
jgi:hypothetical protein